MKAILLIASVSLLLSTASGQNSGTSPREDEYRSIIRLEGDADDYDAPTHQKYVAMPVQVIPVMLQMLKVFSVPREKGTPEASFARRMKEALVWMLTDKLEQYRATVSPDARQAAVDAIINQLEQAKGEGLSDLLIGTKRLKDPKVDQFLMRLKQSNDPETQKMASIFIEDRTK